MKNKDLKIFNRDILSYQERLELRKMNDYYENLISKEQFHNALHFMLGVRNVFEEREIISDIYHRISSIRTILNDSKLSREFAAASKRIYNVYLDCINNRDYRNAIRMLEYYKMTTGNSDNYINLQFAYVYSKISQTDKAIEILDSLTIGFNEEPIYYITLMEIAYRKKKYLDMFRLEKHLIKYDGCITYDTYLKLAEAYYKLGRYNDSKRIYDLVSKMCGNNPGINKTIERSKSKLDEDITYPTKMDLFISYQIELDKKNYDGAITFYKQLMEMNTDIRYRIINEKKLRYLVSLKEGK